MAEFNPFSAPATRDEASALPQDTEFLFNDQCIAGTGTIRMPAVCVVTGERTDLLRRRTRVVCEPPWQFAVLFLTPWLATGIERSGVVQLPVTYEFLIICSGAILAAVFGIASLLVRRSVLVHWSVSRAADRAYRRRQFWYAAGTILVMGILYVSAGNAPGYVIFVTTIWVIWLLSRAARGLNVLKAKGVHEGLIMIVGLSQPCLNEIRRISKSSTGDKP